jgi:HEAT repeat protein
MDDLLENILFPIARKEAMSPWWTKRNWALRCLSLSPRKQDEIYFLNFLCDPATHNRFSAIKPLLQIGSASSLNVIVEVMEDENRHTQAVYLAMTRFGGEHFYEAIRERLKREHDPAAKRVCIDILSDSLENSDIFLIKRSLFDQDKSLRLTAIRCLGKLEMHHSTQLLINFLEDDLWEVRSLVAKFLGSRKAYQAIPLLLENACDKNWWVRLNSIQALFDMGDSGRLALETITPEKDKYAYEMLQYVRTLQIQKDGEQIAEVIDIKSKNNQPENQPEKKSA